MILEASVCFFHEDFQVTTSPNLIRICSEFEEDATIDFPVEALLAETLPEAGGDDGGGGGGGKRRRRKRMKRRVHGKLQFWHDRRKGERAMERERRKEGGWVGRKGGLRVIGGW